MLNVCYIVNDKTDEWFKMSVKQASMIADRFVFVIDRPDSFTWDVLEYAQELKPTVLLHAKYLKNSKTADGQFRTVYLDWLKNNSVGDWALVLDTDEVLSDNCYHLLSYTRQSLYFCYDIRMVHIWWSLGFEDSTVPKHFVQRRMFKVTPDLCYPYVEHPLLAGSTSFNIVEDVIIWHMNVVKSLISEIEKYKKQCVKSNMHTPEMLRSWHFLHILGGNPISKVNPAGLPGIVREFACIDDKGDPVFYKEVKKNGV